MYQDYGLRHGHVTWQGVTLNALPRSRARTTRVYMRVYKRRRPVLVVEDGGVKYSIEPLDAPGITRLTRFYNTRTGSVVRVEFDYENMMEG